MRKWNASMPRQKACEGGANVVLAFRTSTGKRVELQAVMAAGDADMLMRSAITFMQQFKDQTVKLRAAGQDSEAGDA